MDIYHTITLSIVTHSLSSEKIPSICRQISTGDTKYLSFTKWIQHNRIVEKLNIEVSQSMPTHFYPRQHIYFLIGIKKSCPTNSDKHMNQFRLFLRLLATFALLSTNQLLLRFEPDQSSNFVFVLFCFHFISFCVFIFFRPSIDSHTINLS